jgi:hypothetical protein
LEAIDNKGDVRTNQVLLKTCKSAEYEAKVRQKWTKKSGRTTDSRSSYHRPNDKPKKKHFAERRFLEEKKNEFGILEPQTTKRNSDPFCVRSYCTGELVFEPSLCFMPIKLAMGLLVTNLPRFEWHIYIISPVGLPNDPASAKCVVTISIHMLLCISIVLTFSAWYVVCVPEACETLIPVKQTLSTR